MIIFFNNGFKCIIPFLFLLPIIGSIENKTIDYTVGVKVMTIPISYFLPLITPNLVIMTTQCKFPMAQQLIISKFQNRILIPNVRNKYKMIFIRVKIIKSPTISNMEIILCKLIIKFVYT